MGEGRVIYVHPSKLPVDKPCDWSNGASPYLLAPMGIIGLANALRGRGLDVIGINYPMEVALDPTFRLVPWLRQQRGLRQRFTVSRAENAVAYGDRAAVRPHVAQPHHPVCIGR